MMRSTHTSAMLEVPQPVFAWVENHLKSAGYDAGLADGQGLDMSGLGLTVDPTLGVPLTLNGRVRVTLTDHGRAALEAARDSMVAMGVEWPEYPVAPNGTCTLLLRHFMFAFGVDSQEGMIELFEDGKIEYLGAEQ